MPADTKEDLRQQHRGISSGSMPRCLSHYSFCAPQATGPHRPLLSTMRIACLRALFVSAALLISAECAAGLPETKVSSPDVADPKKGPPRRLRVAIGTDENKDDERMLEPSRAWEKLVEVVEEIGAIARSHHPPLVSSPAHEVSPPRPSTSFESVPAPPSRGSTLTHPKDDVSKHAGALDSVPANGVDTDSTAIDKGKEIWDRLIELY